ncbi:hypothetical protein P691DRAFT_791608 [Macrolepiota fuliginosa MF-IS2]|uniref:Uncharacterized protein n=1 Tax=Macrolepiota fuliginosa MF-IS2 TaxID=1400762 RepID=A0A9P5XDP3_9AGAR|nr:hypothetical protein P691DRAFT_791608 [Macrolepiota fuliginosa MF-IS2]
MRFRKQVELVRILGNADVSRRGGTLGDADCASALGILEEKTHLQKIPSNQKFFELPPATYPTPQKKPNTGTVGATPTPSMPSGHDIPAINGPLKITVTFLVISEVRSGKSERLIFDQSSQARQQLQRRTTITEMGKHPISVRIYGRPKGL